MRWPFVFSGDMPGIFQKSNHSDSWLFCDRASLQKVRIQKVHFRCVPRCVLFNAYLATHHRTRPPEGIPFRPVSFYNVSSKACCHLQVSLFIRAGEISVAARWWMMCRISGAGDMRTYATTRPTVLAFRFGGFFAVVCFGNLPGRAGISLFPMVSIQVSTGNFLGVETPVETSATIIKSSHC
jgi:hypothetical protein